MKITIFNEITRRPLRSTLRVIIPIAAVLVIGLALLFLYRPRLVWIVEDQFVEAWEQVLPSSPFRKTKVVPLSAAEPNLPRRWYGYQIGSRQRPSAPDEDESPIRVYRDLSRQGRYEEALSLAIDPWLLFRKAATSPLNREMAERGPAGSGRIYMAGSDPSAVWAWTAQLLQETPGVFSENEDRWNRIGERLFIGRNFQAGAKTCKWEEIWPHLLADDETVWVYSPLSRIQRLSSDEIGKLAADAYPTRPGWNEFGLQAEILWAIPYGNPKKLTSIETWLHSAPPQTQIANALGWLAVNQSAAPSNPVSENAQKAWVAASYVWEAMVKEEAAPPEEI